MNTKKRIIDQTISLISTEGYQDLSLRKLTKLLGLTTGAFYKHFTSKEELLKEVRVEISQEFVNSLHLNSNESSEKQILKIARCFCDQMTTQPLKMEFLLFNSSVSYQDDSEYSLLNKIMELINSVNTNGETSNETFLLQIWSFIQGYALLIKNGATKYDAQLVEKTLNTFIEVKK